MSCDKHQAEINKDLKVQNTNAQIAEILKLKCPFCRSKSLYVHAPGTMHWTGVRTWWTVGCDSIVCSSSWTLEKDGYLGTINALKTAQPKKQKKQV